MTNQVEIPDLKQKKKERRRGGVVWGSGAPVGDIFNGATGGTAMAGDAGILFESAGSVVEGATEGVGADAGFAWLSRAASPFVSAFASLISTPAGRAALFAGLAGLICLLARIIAPYVAHVPPAGLSDAASSLPPIASTIKIAVPDGSGLDFAAKANNGLVVFQGPGKTPDGGKTAPAAATTPADSAPKAPAPQEAAAPTEAAPPTTPAPATQGSAMSLELTGALKGPQAGMFKSNMNFGGIMRGKLGAFAPGGLRGKFSGQLLRSKLRGANVMNLGRRGVVNSRAFGQLATANMLTGAATASQPQVETNAEAAAAMFNGAYTAGTPPADVTSVAHPGGAGAGAVVPPGSGYPCDNQQMEAGGIAVNGQCVICPSGTTPDATSGSCSMIGQADGAPWRKQLDQAKQLVDKADAMIILASMLVIVGGILIGIGSSMEPPNWGLIAAGIAMVVMGFGLAMMAMMIGGQVEAIGKQIEAMKGSASNYGGKVEDLGHDIKLGAILAMAGGVGGIFMALKVKAESAKLLQEITTALNDIKPATSAGGAAPDLGTDDSPNNPNLR